MAENDLSNWWGSLPPVSKWLFAGCFGTTVAAHFGLLSFEYLILWFDHVFFKFQIWRLATAFLWLGPITKSTGMQILIDLMFLVRYGSTLEKNSFAGRTADFVFMVMFACFSLLGIQFVLVTFLPSLASSPLLARSLIMMLIYYWSKITPDVNITFFLGIQFRSRWLPWAMVAFTVLTGGHPGLELMGIIVGHLYFFLNDLYPRIYGRVLISTPRFIQGWFPQPAPQAGVGAEGPRQRYNWGTGNRLGN